jgi:hypothetical protein
MITDEQWVSEILNLFPNCRSSQEEIILPLAAMNSKGFYRQVYCILLQNYHISISGYMNSNSEVEGCRFQQTITPERLFSSLLQ